ERFQLACSVVGPPPLPADLRSTWTCVLLASPDRRLRPRGQHRESAEDLLDESVRLCICMRKAAHQRGRCARVWMLHNSNSSGRVKTAPPPHPSTNSEIRTCCSEPRYNSELRCLRAKPGEGGKGS